MKSLALWDLVTYRKCGKIEIGVIIEIHPNKDPKETTYSLIQEGGLTDFHEHPICFKKVISAKKVPLEYYLEHRSWRVQAHGREILSLEKNIPMLLDKIHFKKTYEVGNHSLRHITGIGVITDWPITSKNEITVRLVDIAFPIYPNGMRVLAIQGFEAIKKDHIGTEETVHPKEIYKVERTLIEESLTSDYDDIRNLANDFLRGEVPRPFLGDLSSIHFPE